MAVSTDWMSEGLCTKRLWPDAWYPEIQDDVTERAKALCKACPVKARCAEAGRFEEHGIWGGVKRSKAKADAERAKAARKGKTKALGAQRRLQALSALGWSGREISLDIRRYSGMSLNPQSLDNLRDGGEKSIPEEVYKAIERCYRRLGRSLSPSSNAVLFVRNAEKNDWPPPRQWRGLDIDDPKDYPDELR